LVLLLVQPRLVRYLVRKVSSRDIISTVDESTTTISSYL